MKSKWIKFAPGRLLDRFLGSNVRAFRSAVRSHSHHRGLVLDTPEKQFYPVASDILPESSIVWYWLTGSDVTHTWLARQR